MAREIRIYEQNRPIADESGFVDVIFVYETRFEREGVLLPLTPLDRLAPDKLLLFTETEQTAINQGMLSWEDIGRIVIPPAASRRDRNTLLFKTYRELREVFRRNIESPKSAAAEFLDLPVLNAAKGGS